MMTFEVFVSVLVASAVSTSVFVDIVKQILDKAGATYDSVILASSCAFIIGFAEIVIYNLANGLGFHVTSFAMAICMGIANAISAQVGYDKVKTLLFSLFGKSE